MDLAAVIGSLAAAYLAGSINFAILISRWARGIDIRKVGSRNPGTSNVGREVGKGWAALVLAGDLAKGVVPLILAKALLFPDDRPEDILVLFLMGAMAITGHCWPLYHGFRGGGGLATSIGVYMFFIPVEFFCSLLFGYLMVQILFSKKSYAFGQLVPMFFVPAAPVFTLLSSLFLDTRLPGAIRLGGHPWYMIAGVTGLSAYIFLVNLRIVRARFSGDTDPEALKQKQ
jgi:glycerol-3-phosphate acyltransferase PlsY